MSKQVLIIGYGIVGHNLAKELETIKPDIVDKYKQALNTAYEQGEYDKEWENIKFKSN